MNAVLYTLILLGSVQGIVMALILWFARPGYYANRLLALILLLIALPGFHLYFHFTGVFQNARWSELLHAAVPWVSIMALGPVIYFYTRSVLDPRFRLDKRSAIWLLPLLIDLIPKIIELAYLARWVPASLFADRQALTIFIDQYNLYADLPRWISLALGIGLASRYLVNYRRTQVAAMASQAERIRWLKIFITSFRVFVIGWLLYLVPYLLPATSSTLTASVGWFPIYVPMAVMIYWMGIRGYQASRVVYESPETIEPVNRSYTPELLKETLRKLEIFMDAEHPYLDPLLDLTRLSAAIGIPAKLISASLNQVAKKSFNLFVNEYRVSTFQQRAMSPGGRSLTIAGLASECGFASSATFQRSFKQITGLTPSQFMRKKAS